MKRSAFGALAGFIWTLSASDAHAHKPNTADNHRSLPNQVSAGVIAACPSHVRYQHADLQATDTAESVACFGASIAFSRELTRDFELRARVTYIKPAFFDDVLASHAHDFEATLSPSFLAYRFADRLTFTLGPEVGLKGFILEDTLRGDAVTLRGADAWGVFVGGSVGIRPWVTFHSGFFAEMGFSYGQVWSEVLEVQSTTLGRVTLGWADRF